MDLLLAGPAPPFPDLRAQWASATVTRRVEPTEGLFVDLEVIPDAPRVSPPRFDLSDVHMEFEGLEGGGFAGSKKPVGSVRALIKFTSGAIGL